ncbi:MAG: hypothetical protein GWP06_08550, partial [Actinobacteria bacterium]|nr:hypothetical protein [Actinomycetota bacterium]
LLFLLPGISPAKERGTTLPQKIGFHKAVYNGNGKLLPWTPWTWALRKEMDWYLNCPIGKHGYPVFIYTTFMDENYKPYRTDTIPCTQLGMGIISYIKYYYYTGRADPKILKMARLMGDYLINETLTPDDGAYPRFTRSTGYNTDFPITRSAQGDEKLGVNVIEPDKGGIAGYALVLLYDATKEQKYLDQAIHNADVLVKNMRQGDATRSPWPFRVDAVTGQYWGERSSNMVYILRLFDALLEKGYTRFRKPRDELWAWIRDVQIPAPESRDASLWVQFFEDMSPVDNRNSWAPLNTARYLIEKKEALDPDWKALAEKCIRFAIEHFGIEKPDGVLLMGEQDVDKRPWGGACSTLGGVAAMFYAAGGGEEYKEIAYRNLNWVEYFIDSDGGPAALCGAKGWKKGSWQEDCHTDVVHNFLDAINAVPEWKVYRFPRKKLSLKKELQTYSGKILCSHKAVYDEHGILQPWTSWRDAMEREMNWYLNCPIEKGYPRFVYYTFMDGEYKLFRDWATLIPATQNGMGIISYLKYYRYTGKKNPKVLRFARYMGDYLVKEAVTPDEGRYPRFSRSTGWAGAVPQPPDCGCQRDLPYEVQPDKAGIAGYALTLLYRETKEKSYLNQALQNARVLAANMRDGDASRSPWPFRVDYRTGQGRGQVSGNMSFILRLFDELLDMGYEEFHEAREKLWQWILNYQLPNLKSDGMLWVQFFEDHEEDNNRTAWAPLNLARYLIEKKEAIDPDWREHARALIDFVNANFTSVTDGVPVCGEQDYDKNPWGGVLSTYGAVLAMYSAAIGDDEFKGIAWQALNYGLYATFDDGRVSESTRHFQYGVWQEDCHTDKIHNYMDAIVAFPEWEE